VRIADAATSSFSPLSELRQNSAATSQSGHRAFGSDPTMKNSNPPDGTARSQIRNIRIDQLRNYRLPLPGIVSILHRVSGMLLFLFLPLVLWLFDLSLSSESSFDRLAQLSQNWVTRVVLLGLSWALLHHLCAGVRFLLLDLHLGADRVAALRSSVAVFAVSLSLTLVLALYVFGAL